jgi:outer membrane protein OmpA-like peptidoglycan-associated protein
MLRSLFFLSLSLLVTSAGVKAQVEKDVEGSQDHPLISRMPGYYISAYDVKDFDSFESIYVKAADARWEGKITKVSYTRQSGAKSVSMLQIVRNYEGAVKKLGGSVLYSDSRIMHGKIQKGKAITWVAVEAFNDGEDYELRVVESKTMEQEVTADAAALSQSIAATGKVAVYGIYFDTGKSTIKPESNPTIDEIVKLLNQNPSLRLYVVGHTDNVGALDFNLKLSADRADGVMKALLERKIDAARLKAAGVGPYCPEASNKTDEGKAKNRRVELVEQ